MATLINKIPVLDKGFVAKFDSSCDGVKLKDLAVEYYKQFDNKTLRDLASLTLLIKCPLFVQLNLATFNLKMANLPNSGQVETYLPNVGEIGASTLETSKAIAEDMERSAAALQMNPLAYQADGCDHFISQILTPINTYNTVLVFGMYNDWYRFASQGNAPSCIAVYADAVDQILKAEWQ